MSEMAAIPTEFCALQRKSLSANSGLYSLFDQLGGKPAQRQWYGQAKRLGSFDIEHEFELGGLLHRQVYGFGTLEDAWYRKPSPTRGRCWR